MVRLNEEKVLLVVFAQIAAVPSPLDGSSVGGLKVICARPYLGRDFIRVFRIRCELVVFSCTGHGLNARGGRSLLC